MRKSKIPPEEIARIVSMCEVGLTDAEIAKQVGVARHRVRYWRMKHGVKSPFPPSDPKRRAGPEIYLQGDRFVRRYSAEEDQLLRALDAQGVPHGKIAEVLGRTKRSVSDRLERLEWNEPQREDAEA